jgi:hypothetical protein
MNKEGFYIRLFKLLIYTKFMQKWHYHLFLSTILFFIPYSIFIIGDWIGAGVQFSLLKIQFSDQGNSIINVLQELDYLKSGIITGRSILTILLWAFGVFLIVISIAVLFVQNYRQTAIKTVYSSILLFFAGIFFLASIITQYGPYLHGPAGTAIPIGLPVLFVISGWMYMEGEKGPGIDIDEVHQSVDESE